LWWAEIQNEIGRWGFEFHSQNCPVAVTIVGGGDEGSIGKAI